MEVNTFYIFYKLFFILTLYYPLLIFPKHFKLTVNLSPLYTKTETKYILFIEKSVF